MNMRTNELVNSGANEQVNGRLPMYGSPAAADELVNTRQRERLSTKRPDPWPELVFSNHAFRVPLPMPEQIITPVEECAIVQVTEPTPLIVWPRFQGTRRHQFSIPLASAQAPSKSTLDKIALDKRAEREGERIDTIEHLNTQLRLGYKLLFSDELRSTGLLNRCIVDQRPLYEYAVDAGVDDQKASNVRKIREREVNARLLARRAAGRRIIENACPVVVDRSEPLNARELKRLTSTRRNRSLLNSGVRRYTGFKLFNWTSATYDPNNH